jgi:hypothetical protein
VRHCAQRRDTRWRETAGGAMRLTNDCRRTLSYLLMRDVPLSVYFDIDEDGDVSAQCHTQEEVRSFRACFRGVVWKKEYNEGCNWWEYSATVNDAWTPARFKVRIYACYEAPPTCVAVEEKYTVEEKVPVTFETRTVEKTRLRWDCGGDKEQQA